jgi:membrane associated rhomboid family serine protease
MPLNDNARLQYVRLPVVNLTLIAINIVVFVAVWGEFFGDPLTVIRGFALIPRVLFGEAELAKWIVGPPPPLTVITSLFFHSSFLHLASNMLFLYVFGDNIEDAMGSLHYFLFYMTCGIVSGVFFAYSSPHTINPLIGASGAISGVCAAFLLLHPRATIVGLFPPLSILLVIVWPLLSLLPRRSPKLWGLTPPLFTFHASAFLFIGAWIVMQVLNAFLGEQGHVAWMAHVGGIVAGLVMTPLFKRRAVPLFGGREAARPAEAAPEEAPPRDDPARDDPEDGSGSI